MEIRRDCAMDKRIASAGLLATLLTSSRAQGGQDSSPYIPTYEACPSNLAVRGASEVSIRRSLFPENGHIASSSTNTGCRSGVIGPGDFMAFTTRFEHAQIDNERLSRDGFD